MFMKLGEELVTAQNRPPQLFIWIQKEWPIFLMFFNTDITIFFSGNNAWILMKKAVFRWLVDMSESTGELLGHGTGMSQ